MTKLMIFFAGALSSASVYALIASLDGLLLVARSLHP